MGVDIGQETESEGWGMPNSPKCIVKRLYHNGSISEHERDKLLKALEQEPCEDAISRDVVQNYVESHIQEINTGYGDLNKHTNEILRMIVDYIEKMESVKPKPKTDVLNKIRAEIVEEREDAYADFERYKVEYLGQDWEDVLDSLPQDDFRYGMERAIEIIDKYKAESEEV